jgi:hypothetical protein
MTTELSSENPADLIVLDSCDAGMAVAEVAYPLFGIKRGRRSFFRAAPLLTRPIDAPLQLTLYFASVHVEQADWNREFDDRKGPRRFARFARRAAARDQHRT